VSRRFVPPILALALTAGLLAACGSSSDSSQPEDAATESTSVEESAEPEEAEPVEPDPTPEEAAADESEPAGDIDWATVDLSDFDWSSVGSIDDIDVEAVTSNPTYDQIDIDAFRAAFPDQGGGDPGSATLTVGDTTYEFDEYLCAFGYSSTESDIFSFSSNSFGMVDGVRVQMQLNVLDDSGGDQLTGEGTRPEIDIDDIEDFENPSISIVSVELVASFDGDSVTAEGTFRDEVAGADGIAGSFEGTCGAGSRR
jgi:hypothetical protein